MREPLRVPRTTAFLAALGLVLAAVLTASPAAADTAPVNAAEPPTVAADALPTVQVDGVVWDQAIVGRKVYAVGNFTTARPAGAAPGASTVTRTHMLAYDLVTGVLDPSFAPTFDQQVRSVSASPDGSRVYVGGEFTRVNGQTRYRVAAFDTANGALTSYAPVVNARVAVVLASSSALYVGGIFSSAGGQPRVRVAALSPSTGLALPFTSTPGDGQVNAMALSPDGSTLVIGGSFSTVDGSNRPGYGLARLDAATGASLPLEVNGLVRNGGANASIYNLHGDEQGFYGVGYVYGSGGNLEGAFSATWGGSLRWLEDCHGDSYDVYTSGPVTYTVGHPHFCGTVGGYPQSDPWQAYYANAYTNFATGPLGRNPYPTYYQFEGTPGPSLLHYFPTFTPGSFTGANQATWTVTGDGTYVVYGGEFTHVNGTRQQGLVRMATSDVAPDKQGPRLSNDTWPLRGVSLSPGVARLSWSANWDRDNETLTYKLYRNTSGNVIDTQTVTAPFWDLPSMGFSDPGRPPGTTQRYRVSATDAFGNTTYSPWVDVVIADDEVASPYADAVLADDPVHFWRMGEPSGPVVYDWAGFNDATAGAGVTRGRDGAVGDTDDAAGFSGTPTGVVAATAAEQGRDTFALEAWFRTTSTAGGKIVGFGDLRSGNSGNYDRHVYLDTSGRVNFGVYPGARRVVTSPESYNDGEWHHVVANLGPTGMSLYVDDQRVGQRTDTTRGQAYRGYWRVGGDSTWSGGRYLQGTIDDVAVYAAPLTPAQVDAHYAAAGRDARVVSAPADAYGAEVFAASPDLYWRLGETAGTTAADAGPFGADGTYRGGYAREATGALVGSTDGAVRFTGSSGMVAGSLAYENPTVYSQELWFRTTTTAGGKLIGFGDRNSGTSGSYDRHVYMETNGRLTFGVWTGTASTITTPAAYNDGAWHHLVATQGPGGMALWVDGQLRGTHAQTAAQEYTGYWRVGGDTTWGPQPWFAGSIDEVAVYSTVLDGPTVARHYALGSGAPEPNLPPVAAFTATADGLTVALDGSASSDPDGTVAAHTWTFEGGGTATGATATHTFPAGGTFDVTLQVTDDDGATATTTQEVQVVAPPPNQKPVAAFTAAADGLTVQVDGSGSADPDGTVASWAWSAPGATTPTASGPTAAFTFPADGRYEVTLVVTDDDGATATRTTAVDVAAPTVLAADTFERAVTSGWGTAETGGAWTSGSGAAGFSVADGVGRHRLATAGANTMNHLAGVASTGTEVRVEVALDQAPTGGGTYVSVLGRRVDAANDYRTRLRFWPDGKVTLQLQNGGTTLAAADVPGLVYTAGTRLAVRLQVVGTSPTTVRAVVWPAGTPEPATWQLTATSSTPGAQAPGTVGLHSYLSGSSTNVPSSVSFDNLWAGPAA